MLLMHLLFFSSFLGSLAAPTFTCIGVTHRADHSEAVSGSGHVQVAYALRQRLIFLFRQLCQDCVSRTQPILWSTPQSRIVEPVFQPRHVVGQLDTFGGHVNRLSKSDRGRNQKDQDGLTKAQKCSVEIQRMLSPLITRQCRGPCVG
jgi:hypothetical protein